MQLRHPGDVPIVDDDQLRHMQFERPGLYHIWDDRHQLEKEWYEMPDVMSP
jgi:hypothetical protein